MIDFSSFWGRGEARWLLNHLFLHCLLIYRCYTAGEEDVPNALRKVDNGNYNLKDATVRESLDNENSKSTSREKILLGECVELLAKGSIINSQAVFFPDNHSTGHKDVGEGAGVASKVGDDKMVVLVKSLQG